ncbi:MAG TPA: putative toxin-antitoxin system toxin component, PIN family [Ensifer sp.]|nr:putative toxin-antitoxin system toxin component, PIN family [Ensifer sp.]
MRIVVDTNVFVGACIGRGPASKVIEACLLGVAEPLLSASLLFEYRDVIARNEIFQRARLDFESRLDLLEIFVGRANWRYVHFKWRPNLRDESDNHLMELAVAGNADVIVTENLRDFIAQDLKFPHIKIMSPRSFTELVRS